MTSRVSIEIPQISVRVLGRAMLSPKPDSPASLRMGSKNKVPLYLV